MLFLFLILLKKLKYHEKVPVVIREANPLYNPLEKYNYKLIPYFKHMKKGGKAAKNSSSISIKYFENIDNAEFCSLNISERIFNTFDKIIKRDFVSKIEVAELPIWNKIGYLNEENKTLVYSHFNFLLECRDQYVIRARMSVEKPVYLELNSTIPFSYEVHWKATPYKYAERYKNYLNQDLFHSDHRYHSVKSSMLTAVFSLFFAYYIYRDFIKRDIIDIENLEERSSSECGWILLYNDVFRPPKYKYILSSLLGIGAYIVLHSFTRSVISWFTRQVIKTTFLSDYFIVFFAVLTSSYFSEGLFKKWGGKKYKQHFIFSYLLPIVSIIILFIILRIISGIYLREGHFYTRDLVHCIYVYIIAGFPGAYIGSIIGRYSLIINGKPEIIGTIEHKVPKAPWYYNTLVIGMLSGMINFSCFCAEAYYILNVIWKYEIYTGRSYFILNVASLVIVVSCTSMISTYFTLYLENHRWKWRSFIASAFIFIFILLECMFFYNERMDHFGNTPGKYFVIFSLFFSCVIGLSCGFVGFISSSIFVKLLYRNLKVE